MVSVKKNVPAEAPKAEAPKAAAKPVAKPAAKPVKAAEPAAPVEMAVPVTVGRKQIAAALVEKVKATGKAIPLSIAEIVVVAYEEVIIEALGAGADVSLTGFGKFLVKDKEACQKRNPATGEQVDVPAHKAVRFKVGAGLKKAVNGGVEVSEED